MNGFKSLLAVSLLALLSACDGGIFGTGDGSNDIIVEASEPTGGTPGGDIPGTDPGPEDTSTPPGSSGVADSVPTIAFENLQATASGRDALISLINLSVQDLNAYAADAGTLFSAAVTSGTVSQSVSVAAGTAVLTVFDAATGDAILVLSPLNLGASSYTSLIARDRSGATALPAIDVIALPARASATDDGVAEVRVLQSAPLDTLDTPADMTLIPGGTEPGSTDVALGTVSSSSFGNDNDYRTVTPGDYRLTDSLSRFTPVLLSFAGGQVYTLIITGTTASPVVVLDSAVQGQ